MISGVGVGFTGRGCVPALMSRAMSDAPTEVADQSTRSYDQVVMELTITIDPLRTAVFSGSIKTNIAAHILRRPKSGWCCKRDRSAESGYP